MTDAPITVPRLAVAPPGAPVDPTTASQRRSLVEQRLERIRGFARDRGATCALLASRANVAWATAGAQHHVVTASETGVARLLVTADGAWLLAPSLEVARLVEEEVPDLGIDVIGVPWWEPARLDEAVARLAGSTRPLDDADLAAELGAARSILDPTDQARLAILGAVGERAVVDALAAVEPGRTEGELAASLIGRLVGARAPVVLVAADGRIARFRHPLPGPLAIRKRVMLVLVAEAWGLHVAVTRFREFEAPDADLAARIAAVADVHRAMVEATVVGATLGDVFQTAQAAYEAAGFPAEWQDHHQGGTIAYQGREVVAVPGDATRIEAGMAFAWNPSIAGTKAEDTFLLSADGQRRFVTGSAPAKATSVRSSRP
ncbi:MAG: M24 family metallopeptidase [Chloroflexi bacterium]|nr:M24 family metallopeptidase [Chloroflexota bacterium]